MSKSLCFLVITNDVNVLLELNIIHVDNGFATIFEVAITIGNEGGRIGRYFRIFRFGLIGKKNNTCRQ